MSRLRMNTGTGRAGRPGSKTFKFSAKPRHKRSGGAATKVAGTRGPRSVKRVSDHEVERLTREAPVRKTREELRTARTKEVRGAKRAPTSRAPRFDARRGASFGGRNGENARPGKFKKDFINEQMYINKAIHKEAEKFIPKHAFADFAISDKLKENLAAKGYTSPSAIQDIAIPVGLSGKDIVGIAATGTGKTAAFLIPIIEKLSKDPKQGAVVLAPTRELAMQIENEFKALSKDMKFFSLSIVGGMPMHYQIKGLKMGVHIIVGTPGRVKDLMLQKKLNLANFSTVVLDEADRMMDMGFIDDMKFILGEMPRDRQSMFFSATFNEKMQTLCGKFLSSPKTIQIKSRDTSENIEQNVVRFKDEADKMTQLSMILKEPFATKVIVFRETKMHTDKLEAALKGLGFRVQALHGDMRNRERAAAVAALASGKIQAVIATDVAARGIDIKDVSLVVNFDTPNNYETYIHRIGRTGRAGATGHALTFIGERGAGMRGSRR
jgi:ATP-dependent RNA helicase RhlE